MYAAAVLKRGQVNSALVVRAEQVCRERASAGSLSGDPVVTPHTCSRSASAEPGVAWCDRTPCETFGVLLFSGTHPLPLGPSAKWAGPCVVCGDPTIPVPFDRVRLRPGRHVDDATAPGSYRRHLAGTRSSKKVMGPPRAEPAQDFSTSSFARASPAAVSGPASALYEKSEARRKIRRRT